VRLEQFLDCFENPRKAGGGWIVQCPVHEDRKNSLSIGEQGGKILVKCHAGCDTRSVLSAVNLSFKDISPMKDNDAVVDRYVYTDEQGNPLFRVSRTASKNFFQERFEEGKFIPGLKGARRVLYKLPELAKAKSVVVVEGEKDVESLRKLGLVATRNPGGAGKWQQSYTVALKGKRVAIIPDNDKPGREHALKVARSIIGVAGSVKIIELREVSEKGDVSDFLTKHTKQELLDLVKASKPLTAADLEQSDQAEVKPAIFENCTDMGNSARFRRMHAENMKHSIQLGWLIYDGKRFRVDDTQEIRRLARQTVRAIYREAADCDDKETREALGTWAKRCEAEQRLAAMLKLAESEPGISVRADIFDKDPFLLNVANGTVDLRTGELRPHNRGDLLTKITPIPYDPKAQCSVWYQFLERVTGESLQLAEFLQKAAGYSLTGTTKEQCFFMLYGTGQNGKSTFINAMSAVLGEYGSTTRTETLLAKKGESIPNDIARLAGLRFVSAVESEGGRRLAESLVKQLTGGDKVSARFLHREFFDFYPTFKLWLAVNHKPRIVGTDLAIWRRVRLVPFTVTIPEKERDRDFGDKLNSELAGILRWAIEGADLWRRYGLGMPAAVETATRDYQQEMDIIGAFISDRCEVAPDGQVSKADVYKAYVEWAEENGERAVNQRELSARLSERGFEEGRNKRQRFWQGLRVDPVTG
jgi:putative DNA primase/helicase